MPTILITAVEPSADRIGAAVMQELKKSHKSIRFIGVGGPQMVKQGLNSLFPISDIAVMGLVEVIPAIPRVLARLKQLTGLAAQEKPDLILSIDSHDFSARLATRLKKILPATPHIHYVAPKVWAWRQGRAAKLKNIYTHLLTDLPFEEPFFKNYGIPTTYVGHSAVTALATNGKISQPSKPTLALLPGSRASEIKFHWPLLLAVYRRLAAEIPHLSATLMLPEERHLKLCQAAAKFDESSIAVVVGEARFAALRRSTAALSKSGTNNLEIALLGLPAVVIYKMNTITYAIAKHLVKVPYISLPNLILNSAHQKPAYPELIQSDANISNITKNLLPLLQNKPAVEVQKTRLKALQTLLRTPKPPAQMAADVISNYMR